MHQLHLELRIDQGKGQETWFPYAVYQEIMDEAVPKGLKSLRLNYLN
jgi:hypothetical protein